MLISQAFPSEFLKAGDLQERTITVVMDRVELKEVGDGSKPVLYFQGKEKGLVLNKTNSNNIGMIYGDDTDDWTGKELILYPTMVDFQGRTVPTIRVRVPPPPKPAQREFRAAATPPMRTASARQELNDEIPF